VSRVSMKLVSSQKGSLEKLRAEIHWGVWGVPLMEVSYEPLCTFDMEVSGTVMLWVVDGTTKWDSRILRGFGCQLQLVCCTYLLLKSGVVQTEVELESRS